MEVDFIGLDVGLKISGDSISRKDFFFFLKEKRKKVFSTVKKKQPIFSISCPLLQLQCSPHSR